MADWIREFGGFQKTDLEAGRLNVSSEVNDFLRRLMEKLAPDVVGLRLADEKKEHELAIEAIDRQAQELFGVSTIDEWYAQHMDRQRTESQRQADQADLRQKTLAEIWTRIEERFMEFRVGGNYSQRSNLSWIKQFRRELRTLNLTEEEALARLKREDRAPEVA